MNQDSNPSILVINRTLAYKIIVISILENQGFSQLRVEYTSNPNDGLKMLEQGGIGLVLTAADFYPRNGLGLEFIRQARQRGYDLPIICYDSNSHRSRAFAAGASAFVVEEIDPNKKTNPKIMPKVLNAFLRRAPKNLQAIADQ